MKKNILGLLIIVLLATGCAGNKSGNLSQNKTSASNQLTSKEKKEGWTLLFDGKSFDGWRGYGKDVVPAAWIIEDEAIKISRPKQGESRQYRGDIIFDRQFKNFELRFDWKVSKAGNSGIFFLAKEIQGMPIFRSSPEFQILDNDNHPDGKQGRDGNRKSASLYDMIPAIPQNSNPHDEWNSGGITVNNGKVTHYQNGVKVVEYELWTDNWLSMIENSKFKGWQEMINVGGEDKQGFIGLQDHGDDIWFKNIKIKVL
jgi:hypothetical protein